ncbi:MAG: lysylphosphatidylglycerol synthase transmembrane domain-containing protein [Herpetosiphon sp.]
MTPVSNLGRKVTYGAFLGAGVFVVLGLSTDMRGVGQSLAGFRWSLLAAVLGWTIFNYTLRWLKWEYYLRKLGVGSGVTRIDSALLFTSGMVMAVTPGKIGEVFKSYLLKQINGTPVAASAPIVVAERLTDGLGMLLLMVIGLNLYPPARPLVLLLLLLAIIGFAAIQYRPLTEWALERAARTRGLRRFAPALNNFYASSFKLLSWRLMLVSTLISVVSWFGECIAFYYVLVGVGAQGDPHLLLVATFIFAASTLWGLVSFLPGGLGVSEASTAALLILLVSGLSHPAVAAATILIRFCTLWFGVILGLFAVLLFQQRHRSTQPSAAQL